MNEWELAGILSKALVYLGMLAAMGGSFVLLLCRRQPALMLLITRRFMMPALLIGLVATCLYFLVQVGSVNQRGIAGMFDPLIGSILVDTEIGSALRWRLAGFMLALLCLMPLNFPGVGLHHRGIQAFCMVMALAAAGSFMLSVSVQGHSSALSMQAQGLVAFHVLAIGCWAGALYPLYLAVAADSEQTANTQQLADMLQQFGRYAWVMLTVMVITGVSLFWLLTGGFGTLFSTLFSTLYGQLFLAKVLLVAAMMGLGAVHKFRWVPRLRGAAEQMPGNSTMHHLLARSIRFETGLAVVVLLITASMTSITGPQAG
jgi:putative copper resistance protein D